MKTRLLLLFGVVLTLALLFAGGAQPSTAAVQPAAPTLPFGHPDAPPPESLPQAPITDTFKIYLPLVQRDFVYLIGPNVPFAYGWGVYEYWGYRPGWPGGHNTTSFNWVKITQNPPEAVNEFCDGNRLPYNVLIRLNFVEADATDMQWVKDRAFEWASDMKNSSGDGKCAEAFEVGNEPNLSVNGAYNGAVNPERYADQLCAAYTGIKTADPSFIVVSAGLAPTGNIGQPTLVMDEETFMRRMLDRIRDTHDGNAGACFDAFGYHNYGFRTGYSTAPDSAACPDGMCFRGIERIMNILIGDYHVNKRIWTTEVGWLRDFMQNDPPCTNLLLFFGGFQNSDQGQANQLAGAFQYAREHWPWSGAMFVFNLDFNRRPQDPCADEQGWFAVQGFPAEQALETMEKP